MKYTIRKTTKLSEMELGRVELYPWGGDYRVEMLFKIGHDDEALYVNLLSYEANPSVLATERNGAVWEDSCMEFFVSPSADLSAGYFNFETNAATLLLYHGYGRDARRPIDPEKWPNESLKLECEKGLDPLGRPYWKKTYRIPYALLKEYAPEANLSDGAILRANLYRCGANGQPSHYGVWSPIDTTAVPKADFHRPEYFGEMILE